MPMVGTACGGRHSWESNGGCGTCGHARGWWPAHPRRAVPGPPADGAARRRSRCRASCRCSRATPTSVTPAVPGCARRPRTMASTAAVREPSRGPSREPAAVARRRTRSGRRRSTAPARSTSPTRTGRGARRQRLRRPRRADRPRRQHRASSCARGPVTSTTAARRSIAAQVPVIDNSGELVGIAMVAETYPSLGERARSVLPGPAHVPRVRPAASAWPGRGCWRG